MTPTHAPLPAPPSERRSLAIAAAVLAAGVVLVVLALTGVLGGNSPAAAAVPPPVTVPVTVPAAAQPAPVVVAAKPSRASRAKKAKERRDVQRFVRNDTVSHVPAAWVGGFYRLYEIASKTFGVNWLLIASIHKQETAFSTHPTTYHGLNFANCCAGPMQFNVTNGPVSTWDQFKDSYRRAKRPAAYNHRTASHPSVYDDFDAVMAAGALLAANGAGATLDAAAWRAAYLYYGPDVTGVGYADQVVGRAIGWGRKGFCVNCEADPATVAAVAAAWGDPVRASYAAPPTAKIAKKSKKKG